MKMPLADRLRYITDEELKFALQHTEAATELAAIHNDPYLSGAQKGERILEVMLRRAKELDYALGRIDDPYHWN